MNAGENSNMNMNLIMPGRSLESKKCWPCIFLPLVSNPKAAESQIEKLAKKVGLIFAAYALNDLLDQEVISAFDIKSIF